MGCSRWRDGSRCSRSCESSAQGRRGELPGRGQQRLQREGDVARLLGLRPVDQPHRARGDDQPQWDAGLVQQSLELALGRLVPDRPRVDVGPVEGHAVGDLQPEQTPRRGALGRSRPAVGEGRLQRLVVELRQLEPQRGGRRPTVLTGGAGPGRHPHALARPVPLEQLGLPAEELRQERASVPQDPARGGRFAVALHGVRVRSRPGEAVQQALGLGRLHVQMRAERAVLGPGAGVASGSGGRTLGGSRLRHRRKDPSGLFGRASGRRVRDRSGRVAHPRSGQR
jgi:hypothetical protein